MQNIESPDTPIRGYFSISESYREKLRGEASSAKERNGESNQSLEREKMLLKRLMETEDVYDEVSIQLRKLKKTMQSPTTLENKFVDPAVCVFIQTLQCELELTEQKYKKTRKDLDACTLTPESYIGKRLMAKYHRLKRENEELCIMVSKGRVAKLETELAMQKAATKEAKKSLAEKKLLFESMERHLEAFELVASGIMIKNDDYQENEEGLEAQNAELKEFLGLLERREKRFKAIEEKYRLLKEELRRQIEDKRKMLGKQRNANDSNKPDGEKSGHLSDEDSEAGSGDEEMDEEREQIRNEGEEESDDENQETVKEEESGVDEEEDGVENENGDGKEDDSSDEEMDIGGEQMRNEGEEESEDENRETVKEEEEDSVEKENGGGKEDGSSDQEMASEGDEMRSKGKEVSDYKNQETGKTEESDDEEEGCVEKNGNDKEDDSDDGEEDNDDKEDSKKDKDVEESLEEDDEEAEEDDETAVHKVSMRTDGNKDDVIDEDDVVNAEVDNGDVDVEINNYVADVEIDEDTVLKKNAADAEVDEDFENIEINEIAVDVEMNEDAIGVEINKCAADVDIDEDAVDGKIDEDAADVDEDAANIEINEDAAHVLIDTDVADVLTNGEESLNIVISQAEREDGTVSQASQERTSLDFGMEQDEDMENDGLDLEQDAEKMTNTELHNETERVGEMLRIDQLESKSTEREHEITSEDADKHEIPEADLGNEKERKGVFESQYTPTEEAYNSCSARKEETDGKDTKQISEKSVLNVEMKESETESKEELVLMHHHKLNEMDQEQEVEQENIQADQKSSKIILKPAMLNQESVKMDHHKSCQESFEMTRKPIQMDQEWRDEMEPVPQRREEGKKVILEKRTTTLEKSIITTVERGFPTELRLLGISPRTSSAPPLSRPISDTSRKRSRSETLTYSSSVGSFLHFSSSLIGVSREGFGGSRPRLDGHFWSQQRNLEQTQQEGCEIASVHCNAGLEQNATGLQQNIQHHEQPQQQQQFQEQLPFPPSVMKKRRESAKAEAFAAAAAESARATYRDLWPPEFRRPYQAAALAAANGEAFQDWQLAPGRMVPDAPVIEPTMQSMQHIGRPTMMAIPEGSIFAPANPVYYQGSSTPAQSYAASPREQQQIAPEMEEVYKEGGLDLSMPKKS